MTPREDIDVKDRPSDGSAPETDIADAPPAATPRAVGEFSGPQSAGDAPIVEIHAAKLLKVLAYCIASLVVLHLLAMWARFGFGYSNLRGLIPLFNLEAEQNAPTFFSSMQLFITSLFLGLCAARHRLDGGRYFRHWAGLSVIFTYLALDETALIHEKTSNVLKEVLGTSGIFYYAWVIPFGLFALVVFVTYIRFLLALPRSTALLFVTAGAVFLTGAIGMEMLQSRISEAGGYSSYHYMVLVTIEETLEMSGIFIFLFGLLRYMNAAARPYRLALAK